MVAPGRADLEHLPQYGRDAQPGQARVLALDRLRCTAGRCRAEGFAGQMLAAQPGGHLAQRLTGNDGCAGQDRGFWGVLRCDDGGDMPAARRRGGQDGHDPAYRAQAAVQAEFGGEHPPSGRTGRERAGRGQDCDRDRQVKAATAAEQAG